MYFSNTEIIQAYNIEHIVSNSFGVDNTDWRNGVPLHEKINKRKGNIMLFLYWDDLEWIKSQKTKQFWFLARFTVKQWFMSHFV